METDNATSRPCGVSALDVIPSETHGRKQAATQNRAEGGMNNNGFGRGACVVSLGAFGQVMPVRKTDQSRWRLWQVSPRQQRRAIDVPQHPASAVSCLWPTPLPSLSKLAATTFHPNLRESNDPAQHGTQRRRLLLFMVLCGIADAATFGRGLSPAAWARTTRRWPNTRGTAPRAPTPLVALDTAVAYLRGARTRHWRAGLARHETHHPTPPPCGGSLSFPQHGRRLREHKKY